MAPNPLEQMCPTCHKLMPQAQLAQLNNTLYQLLGAKNIDNIVRTKMIEMVSTEITRVSSGIRPDEIEHGQTAAPNTKLTDGAGTNL